MTLTEDSPFTVDESNSKNPPVLKFQTEGDSDPLARIVAAKFDRTFNSVNSRNRKTGAFHHALETSDAISDLAKRH